MTTADNVPAETAVVTMVPAAPLARAPALARQRTSKLPTVADTVLDNGLRVLAVRRPGVPLVELRLRVPFAAPTGQGGKAHVARATLLSDALLSGTAKRSAFQIAVDLQSLGGQLSASTDADRLGFGGSVLSSGLGGLLDLLGELLTSASYPKREVEGERDRLVQELAIHRSSAGVIAREALMARMYVDHPYALDLPTAEDLAEVRPKHLRALHQDRVVPQGSVLTLVGDIAPARAAALVARAFRDWTSSSTPKPTPPAPAQKGRKALLLDRPGAVQTTIRFGGAAPSRTDEGYAAAALANLVFGGYFSSRWVSNIREDKGYTYSPHSGIDHPPAGSRLVAGADVATAVTAPALLETLYELGQDRDRPRRPGRARPGPPLRDRDAGARHRDAGRAREPYLAALGVRAGRRVPARPPAGARGGHRRGRARGWCSLVRAVGADLGPCR